MNNSQNESRPERYRVKVSQYIDYRRDGFIVARGLASRDVVEELKCYADDMLTGQIDAPGARPLQLREHVRRTLRPLLAHPYDPPPPCGR